MIRAGWNLRRSSFSISRSIAKIFDRVGTGDVEPGPDGVGQAVVAAEDDHVGRLDVGLLQGHRRPSADSGGQLKRQGRLADAGLALQQGDLAQGDAPPPHSHLTLSGLMSARLVNTALLIIPPLGCSIVDRTAPPRSVGPR